MTVAVICESFGIVKSTLYAWKAQFLEHKGLMLGELLNRTTLVLSFIREHLGSESYPSPLQRFFNKLKFSFLQTKRKTSQVVPP